MNSSLYSSSIESAVDDPFTEEQETMLYKSIVMNLQAIRKSLLNINGNLKSVQKIMRITEALTDAIETNNTRQDVANDDDQNDSF